MQRSTHILLGLSATVVAAVLFAAGEFFLEHGELVFQPAADPEAFGRMVTGTGFAIYAGRGLVGVFLEALGVVALYLYLQHSRVERLAFWGMSACLLGDVAGGALFGILYFLYPALGALMLEGHTGIAAALEASPGLLMANAIPTLLGLGLLAVAIWRSGLLPKWAGVLMLVGFLLLPVQAVVIQVAGNVLWGLGGLWIVVHAWQARDAWASAGVPADRIGR